MIGGLQGDFGDLDIKYLKKNISKYLKQNISKCRSHISGSFRRTSWHYAKSAAKLSGWALSALCKMAVKSSGWALSANPDMSIRGNWNAILYDPAPDSDVKYPEKVERRSYRISDVGYPKKMEHRKGDRLRVHGVGTPPPNDTECASLFGSTPSGFPKRTCGALPLSRLP